MERAVVITRGMRDADPQETPSLHLWLLMIEPLSQIYTDTGDRKRANAMHDRIMRDYPQLIEQSGDVAGMRRSFSSALHIVGGTYYNLQDYGRACAAWRAARTQLAWLNANGKFTDADEARKANIGQYLTSSCENGVPRTGMDASI